MKRLIMKNETKIVVLMSLFAIMTATAQADQFINPPETYAPVWYTSFPYQRNIDMGFAVNPVAAPSDTGIPGAVYEGTLDPSLMGSDYVTLNNVTWSAGGIGINNVGGNTTLTGTAIFHIDNVDDNLPVKDVWIEALSTSTGGSFSTQVFDPNVTLGLNLGCLDSPLQRVVGGVYNGDMITDDEWQITPNPLYETVDITFSAPAGDTVFINNLHIATECVPEPATFSLLALGALALLRRRQGKV
jgi:hypothetical protein